MFLDVDKKYTAKHNTASRICRQLKISPQKLKRILRDLEIHGKYHIGPSSRKGGIKVYTENDIQKVRISLSLKGDGYRWDLK